MNIEVHNMRYLIVHTYTQPLKRKPSYVSETRGLIRSPRNSSCDMPLYRTIYHLSTNVTFYSVFLLINHSVLWHGEEGGGHQPKCSSLARTPERSQRVVKTIPACFEGSRQTSDSEVRSNAILDYHLPSEVARR